MSQSETVTVEPDGSTTFETPQAEAGTEETVYNTTGGGEESFTGEEIPPEGGAFEEAVKAGGVDPALYVLAGVFVFIVMYYILYRRRKSQEAEDDFFSNLDGEKFNLKLPAEVDEYYAIKDKCLAAGWQPGSKPPSTDANAQGPHRVMAQALMKRAMADIPIVTHIQKESAGMNKLYSQSMCSVNQWRAYQSAENLVSTEVEEVRAEADEIEPGWSGVIWRQAMQYHNMLKQKHEQEAKVVSEQARKKKEIESKVMAEKKKIEDAKAKELAAERAAEELIKAEEREKESKKAFSGSGMKKGFLDSKKK